MSKLICHFCGGAGINISDKVFTQIAELGDGFSEVVFNYLDTSLSNITKIDRKGEFWQITTRSHTKAVINGSGGETRTHATDIAVNIQEYLDSKKYTKPVNGEFHVVVSSASGGTGAAANPILVNNLMQRDIPVIVVLVGDGGIDVKNPSAGASGSALTAMNTLNTIANLSRFASMRRKTLCVVYTNNSFYKGGEQSSIKDANKTIFNTMAVISLFLSGKNEAIDYQDMLFFLDQTKYTRLSIPEGIYGVVIGSGNEINHPEEWTITGVRSLTTDKDDFRLNVMAPHQKTGKVTDENALSVFDGQFPIHLVSFANFFKEEERRLKQSTDIFAEKIGQFHNDEIGGTSDGKIDDDTGLIL